MRAEPHGKPNIGNKLNKHLFLDKANILYDIDAMTSLVSKTRRSGDNPDDALATSESDRYRPLFDRWIEKYTQQAKARLKAYILTPVRVASMNDLKTWKECEITLTFPPSWNDTVYESMVSAIHDYIVNGCLYEYFSLTLTSKDSVTVDCQQKMLDSYMAMKNYACAVIPGTVHKPLQPF
jgi:hypothetical protein